MSNYITTCYYTRMLFRRFCSDHEKNVKSQSQFTTVMLWNNLAERDRRFDSSGLSLKYEGLLLG
jgi:hypothetical protein